MQWTAVYVSMLAYPSAADPQPRYAKGSIVITLDPDVAAVFPGARQTNEALRALVGLIRRHQPRRRHGKAHNQEVPRETSAREKIMKRQYLVRIDKEVGSDWGASVPDLPGCVATGKTIDAALRRIEGAIELHMRGLREDGIRIPPSRQRVVRPRRTSKQVNFYATVEVAA